MVLAAVLIARLRRRHDEPVPVVAAEPPPEEPKPVGVPWRRSALTGPSWNEKPPPSQEGSWAESPSKAPEPQPDPEPWTAPRSKRPVR